MRGRALRTAAMLSVALIATALSGCSSSPTPPTPAPSPSPTASPLFASEEEALAAATEAYAAYQAVADEVAEAGGAGADKYEQVATGDALAKGRESAEEYQKAGAYAVGSTVVEFVDMQQAQLQAADSELLFYVCLDLSGVDVMDGSGKSIVAPDRPDRVLLEVAAESDRTQLLISRTRVWAQAC